MLTNMKNFKQIIMIFYIKKIWKNKMKKLIANHKIFARLPGFPGFSRVPEKFPGPGRIPG